MRPRLSVITLAVGDLERSVRFYRDGLGLTTDGHLWEVVHNPAWPPPGP
jgi:uncharacterized protein